MQLIGRFLSPFVRRVGTTLNLYEIPFEHRSLSVSGDERAAVRDANPLTRVPSLILDDGEILIDSSAIVDHLDQIVGAARALTPASGSARRQVLKRVSVALGAAEKAVLTVYEKRYRPEEKWHAPWTDMCGGQARDGLQWLDANVTGPWMTGEQLTQADVCAVCAYDFVRAANADLFASLQCPALDAISQYAGALDAFKRTAPPAG